MLICFVSTMILEHRQASTTTPSKRCLLARVRRSKAVSKHMSLLLSRVSRSVVVTSKITMTQKVSPTQRQNRKFRARPATSTKTTCKLNKNKNTVIMGRNNSRTEIRSPMFYLMILVKHPWKITVKRTREIHNNLMVRNNSRRIRNKSRMKTQPTTVKTTKATHKIPTSKQKKKTMRQKVTSLTRPAPTPNNQR